MFAPVLSYNEAMDISNRRISLKPVRERAEKLGIENPHALSREAGITYNTAIRFWKDDPTMSRLESDVLIKLALTLDCQPGDLITME